MKNSGFGGDKYYLVKGQPPMAQANIDALLAQKASIIESLRIKQASLANINPNYQMNQAYIAKLKAEVGNLNQQLADTNASLNAVTKVTTATNTPTATPIDPAGTPYDETGNLRYGWHINPETGQPYYSGVSTTKGNPTEYIDQESVTSNNTTQESIGPGKEQQGINTNEDPFEKARRDAIAARENENSPTEADVLSAGSQAAGSGVATPVAFASTPDWRFRIKLAPQSDYLYNAPNPGILAPLKGKGVIFPYTPTISVTYTAKYDTNAIAHSNYNVYTYQGSAVENITVTGDFTAQDITEANYMLAVIHFCRSATKMFYGQDKNRGVPPPLLYLSGLGEYQFDNHPVVLTNFTYTLPNDVDYINAYPSGGTTGINGASLTPFQQPGFGRELGGFGSAINSVMRLFGAGLTTRGTPTSGGAAQGMTSSAGMTRMPTKISISLTFSPMITRYAVSNKFSLTDYASGKLLQGSKNAGFGGGMW